MGESFPTCYEQFIEYGRHEGLFELLFQLVEDDDLSLEKAAKKAAKRKALEEKLAPQAQIEDKTSGENKDSQ